MSTTLLISICTTTRSVKNLQTPIPSFTHLCATPPPQLHCSMRAFSFLTRVTDCKSIIWISHSFFKQYRMFEPILFSQNITRSRHQPTDCVPACVKGHQSLRETIVSSARCCYMRKYEHLMAIHNQSDQAKSSTYTSVIILYKCTKSFSTNQYILWWSCYHLKHYRQSVNLPAIAQACWTIAQTIWYDITLHIS